MCFVQVKVHMNGEEQIIPTPSSSEAAPSSDESSSEDTDVPSGDCSYTLDQLAYARSGDKGNSSNIGNFSFFSFNC